MKVLHVIARMNVGGTATYLFNLLEALGSKGISTLLVVSTVPGNELEDSRLSSLHHERIDVMTRAILPWRDFRALLDLRRVVDNFEPNLIHSHTFKAGLLTRVLRTSVPVIHTFHGHHMYDPDYNGVERWILCKVEQRLAKRAKRLIAVGDKVKEDLIEQGIGLRNQYISIPPEVKVPQLAQRQKILQFLSLDPSKPNILWMGRLTRVKRPDRAVEIAKRLPNYNCVIAGDGELKSSLQNEAPSNVTFLGVKDSNQMLSVADVVLLTSDSEGKPLTLIEAQMAGIATIAIGVGSVTEIVEDGITGFVTSNEITEISARIEELIEDKALRAHGSVGSIKEKVLAFH